MFVCSTCQAENLSAYRCKVCGGRVRLEVDVQEQPEEPLAPFNRVLWFAMVLLICSVLALQFAGLL